MGLWDNQKEWEEHLGLNGFHFFVFFNVVVVVVLLLIAIM